MSADLIFLLHLKQKTDNSKVNMSWVKTIDMNLVFFSFLFYFTALLVSPIIRRGMIWRSEYSDSERTVIPGKNLI